MTLVKKLGCIGAPGCLASAHFDAVRAPYHDRRFFKHVQASVAESLVTRTLPCACVEALDRFVQSGRVSHRQAGVMASQQFAGATGWMADYSFNLLYVLFVYSTSHKHCQCLHTVLAWGTCPHVIATHTQSNMVLLPVLATCRRPELLTLLSFGCKPCGFTEPQKTTCMALAGVDLQQAQQQWCRWHARCRKRAWLRVVW
jgi:hypothetical protein